MCHIKYADHEREFHTGSVKARVTNDRHRNPHDPNPSSSPCLTSERGESGGQIPSTIRVEKERYTPERERGDYGQRQRRWSRSPSEGRECLTHRQGSSSVSGSPVPSTSGTSTPRRGRRQLPQTPATPRPHITYSPVIRKPVGTPPSGPQSRLPTPTQRRFSPPVPEPSVPPHHGSGRRARWCPGSSESAPGDNFYDYERCEPPAYEPNPGQGNPHPHNPAPHPRSPRTAYPAGARHMPNGYRSSSPSPQRPPHSAPHKPPHPRGPRKGLHEPYNKMTKATVLVKGPQKSGQLHCLENGDLTHALLDWTGAVYRKNPPTFWVKLMSFIICVYC
ncbi:voltage-dependent P/Q-type calcium channel subunit alpha-1A isoform X20 [Silurus asotus]|uniref:Voltage-dependent P/Q-type calcium channel subunit alpha-1A isoform X20 n=1 Tax=Silurus asotus TaxID=30991 RepID=A0AAD5B2T1_SILAS|nr:voltage-dependent P/Q-type calcium channel subunit alpha-1A isoform X20 [Silurus asotus]